MDSVFISACQGAGLALAAGLLAGALTGAAGLTGPARTGVAIAAIATGAALFALSLDASHHAAWPGVVGGAIAVLPAFALASSVVTGAGRRSGASNPAVVGMVAVFAAVLAGLSLVVAPVSLLALAAIVALLASRRGREARKYEGLRVLR